MSGKGGFRPGGQWSLASITMMVCVVVILANAIWKWQRVLSGRQAVEVAIGERIDEAVRAGVLQHEDARDCEHVEEQHREHDVVEQIAVQVPVLGLTGGRVEHLGRLPFIHLRRYMDEIVTVSEDQMVDAIRRLELPLTLQFNRARLMVLPLGASKASGLREALRALRLHRPDILILVSGGAGLFAALHAHPADPSFSITVAVKGLLGKSGCTRMVQGGYNVGRVAFYDFNSIPAASPSGSLQRAPPCDPTSCASRASSRASPVAARSSTIA